MEKFDFIRFFNRAMKKEVNCIVSKIRYGLKKKYEQRIYLLEKENEQLKKRLVKENSGNFTPMEKCEPLLGDFTSKEKCEPLSGNFTPMEKFEPLPPTPCSIPGIDEEEIEIYCPICNGKHYACEIRNHIQDEHFEKIDWEMEKLIKSETKRKIKKIKKKKKDNEDQRRGNVKPQEALPHSSSKPSTINSSSSTSTTSTLKVSSSTTISVPPTLSKPATSTTSRSTSEVEESTSIGDLFTKSISQSMVELKPKPPLMSNFLQSSPNAKVKQRNSGQLGSLTSSVGMSPCRLENFILNKQKLAVIKENLRSQVKISSLKIASYTHGVKATLNFFNVDSKIKWLIINTDGDTWEVKHGEDKTEVSFAFLEKDHVLLALIQTSVLQSYDFGFCPRKFT